MYSKSYRDREREILQKNAAGREHRPPSAGNDNGECAGKQQWRERSLVCSPENIQGNNMYRETKEVYESIAHLQRETTMEREESGMLQDG